MPIVCFLAGISTSLCLKVKGKISYVGCRQVSWKGKLTSWPIDPGEQKPFKCLMSIHHFSDIIYSFHLYRECGIANEVCCLVMQSLGRLTGTTLFSYIMAQDQRFIRNPVELYGSRI